MITRLAGGKVVDPVSGATGIRDLYLKDGRLIAPPPDGTPADAVFDCAGKVVMAGAIDVHSHIAGGNLALARLLMPEVAAAGGEVPVFGGPALAAGAVGRRYAEMGYTLAVEPAMMPAQALHTHLELSDIPLIDRAALAVVGNDDHLLSLLREGAGRSTRAEAVAQTLAAARGFGLKVVNAGGGAAFHSGCTSFDLDDEVPNYGLSARTILSALLDVADDLGLPHPLHVHANNASCPGGPETIARTIEVAEGRRLHLAHLQFYAYARHVDGGITSGAEEIAALIAAAPDVSCDVGQVMFGPTATISLDLVRQWAGAEVARPHKAVIVDGDAEGGGIVPMTFRADNPVHALQWAIGLELLLLSPDPWRVLLSTDHPNGGPFTSYPQIVHLLMDAGERGRWIARLPDSVRRRSQLAALTRQYSLEEIAVMTRAAPARLLGLADRGHLMAGAIADVAVYDDLADRTAMFSAARLVFKDGRLAVRDGQALEGIFGHTLALAGDGRPMDDRMADYLADRYGVAPASLAVPDAAFGERSVFRTVPWRR